MRWSVVTAFTVGLLLFLYLLSMQFASIERTEPQGAPSQAQFFGGLFQQWLHQQTPSPTQQPTSQQNSQQTSTSQPQQTPQQPSQKPSEQTQPPAEKPPEVPAKILNATAMELETPLLAGLKIQKNEKLSQCVQRAKEWPPNKPPYFLSAVVMFRIWNRDWMQTDFGCFVNWIEWIFFAGVQHLYIYDNYQAPEEKQEANLQYYIKAGLISYFPWNASEYTDPYKNEAFMNVLQFRSQSKWMYQLDIDEFPYRETATTPGWLIQWLRHQDKEKPHVHRWILQNKFYSGPPENENPKLPIYLNYVRRANEVSEGRRKVIFRMEGTYRHQIHFAFGDGDERILGFDELEFHHYWGRRLTWLNDAYTIDNRTMFEVHHAMKRSQSWALPCLPQAFPGYMPCSDKDPNCATHIPITIDNILERTGNVIYSPPGLE